MKTDKSSPIAILGISSDPNRYGFRANRALRKAGFGNLVGIHPTLQEVEKTPVVPRVEELKGPVHTLTLYVSPTNQMPLIDGILALKPQRIIFNPGAENSVLEERARAAGIETLEACTLVLLATNEF